MKTYRIVMRVTAVVRSDSEDEVVDRLIDKVEDAIIDETVVLITRIENVEELEDK